MEMHDHFTINEKNLDVNWQKKFQDYLMTITMLMNTYSSKNYEQFKHTHSVDLVKI
jgi:hypothetical protein